MIVQNLPYTVKSWASIKTFAANQISFAYNWKLKVQSSEDKT